MSEADADVTVRKPEPGEGFDVPVVRYLTVAGSLAFWLWLVARWLNDWGVIPPSVGVAPGEPFLDPALFGTGSSLAFAVEFLPQLANAAWLTVILTVTGIAAGFVIAVPVSVARVYGDTSAYLSLAFTELIRGTPLLAQLFVLYYGLNLSQYFRGFPEAWFVPASPVLVAIIGFTINSAAYQAEYIRSALLSVDRKQLTAARAVGLSELDGIRYVVLPQGLRYAIPGWTNELIYLIKYSSLAAFITVPELFNVAEDIASDNFQYTAIFALVALFYLALVVSASQLMEYVGRKVAIPGVGAASER